MVGEIIFGLVFVLLIVVVVVSDLWPEDSLVKKQKEEDRALKDEILASKQEERDRALRGDPRRGYPFNIEKRMENPQPYFGAARVAVEAKIYRKKLEGVIGRMGLKLDLGVSIGDMENVIVNYFNYTAFEMAVDMVNKEGARVFIMGDSTEARKSYITKNGNIYLNPLSPPGEIFAFLCGYSQERPSVVPKPEI